MRKQRKDSSVNIDIGLAVLDIMRPQGVPITRECIAETCGCTPEYIYNLEKRGIQKLQHKLRNPSDYLSEDMIDGYTQHIREQLHGALS